MPALPNPKHEMFCRAMVRGSNQTKAHKEAGYAGTASNASLLMKRPEIHARMQELIEERERASGKPLIPIAGENTVDMDLPQSEAEVTPEWIMLQLVETANAARQAGQFAPAIKSLELLGRSLGMFSEEEVAKRKRGDQEAMVDAMKKDNAIPIDMLNKVLTAAGFQGVVDLTQLKPQQGKLTAEDVKASK